MFGIKPVDPMFPESWDDPPFDFRTVSAVNGALAYPQRRDVVDISAHPLSNGGYATGLAGLARVTLGFQLADLAGSRSLGCPGSMAAVWFPVCANAHGHPA